MSFFDWLTKEKPVAKPIPTTPARVRKVFTSEEVQARQAEEVAKLDLEPKYRIKLTLIDNSIEYTEPFKGWVYVSVYKPYVSSYIKAEELPDQHLTVDYNSSYGLAKNQLYHGGDILIGDKSISAHVIKMKEVVAV